MLKLLVFDVDGTLYDLKHHEIPQSCRKAIARAKQNGLRFCHCDRPDALWVRAALNAPQPDYILAVNGAVVADGQGRILSHHDFTPAMVERINAFAARRRPVWPGSLSITATSINTRRKTTGYSRKGNPISGLSRLSTVRNRIAIRSICRRAPACMRIRSLLKKRSAPIPSLLFCATLRMAMTSWARA